VEDVQTYLDHPYLTDQDTINYLKSCKSVMFLLRGLPGSGKSTLVGQLGRVYPESVRCSADDFFLSSQGGYHFDRNLLKEAHADCQQKAREVNKHFNTLYMETGL